MSSILKHFRGTEKPVSNRLIIRGQLGDSSSYDFHSRIIIDGLLKRGWDLCVVPYNQDAWSRVLDERYERLISRQPKWDAPTLIIHPPKQVPDDPDRTIYSTMWETTRIPQAWIRHLNSCRAVIVPSLPNIATFSAQGVNVPQHPVPFGIDTKVFRAAPFSMRDKIVFGTSGISRHGWPRKGFDEVVDAFIKAFPEGNEDVELRIKCYPRDPMPSWSDKRIIRDEGEWPKEELAGWYQSIDCYVSMSKGEGFGLMPLECMAAGRPCLLPAWFGPEAYANESNSFLVDYTLVPATNYYEGQGLWCEPSVDHAAAIMRQLYKRPEMIRAKAKTATIHAHKYTYDKMVEGYENVINKHFGIHTYGY